MLGKGGTHLLLTLGYGPINTHPNLSIIFYYVEGEGKMGFCKEDTVEMFKGKVLRA
jgi:hypothetical protein